MKPMLRPAVLGMALLGLGGCARVAERGPALHLPPSPHLVGEPVVVRASGLVGGEGVTLRASGKDGGGLTWRTTARYTVGSDGTLDLRRDPSTAGGYAGVDPAGIFWSLAPEGLVKSQPFLPVPQVDLSLLRGDKEVARGRVQLTPSLSLVSTQPTGKVVGTFHVPAELRTPSPAIVVLAGSEGGMDADLAATLASRLRLPVLALAYFGPLPGLPPTLSRIPLERLQDAFVWLGEQPMVLKDRVVLVGASRGAELALLAAATFPDQVRGVAAQAPTTHCWEDGRGRSSWSWQGAEVPCLEFKMAPQMGMEVGKAIHQGTPFRTAQIYEHSLQQNTPEKLASARIPLERARGPILLVGSGDDGVWPSARATTDLAARLAEKAYAHPVKALVYPTAGHVLRPPYLPTTVGIVVDKVSTLHAALGGTPAANATAAEAWWTALVDFLRKAVEGAR